MIARAFDETDFPLGRALMPRSVVDAFPERGRLRVHTLASGQDTARTVMIWRKGAQTPKGSRAHRDADGLANLGPRRCSSREEGLKLATAHNHAHVPPDTGSRWRYTAFAGLMFETAVPGNVVISLESFEGDRSVDVFMRPDGKFGIEEFRRDPEDGGKWYSIAHYSGQVFDTKEDAVTYAKAHVSWLGKS